jgi:putative FmdB family regulatory protein
MPIYVYVCEKCQERFELVRKFANYNDPVNCPKCNSDNCMREISKNTFKLIGKWS